MSKKKVAIVEDDLTISQMYRMKLEMEGFEVQVAGDGEQGVILVQSFKPDVVLLDVRMPKMNGDEALVLIRKEEWGKKIPVLVLTNTGREEFLPVFKPLDIVDFIVKAESTPKDVVLRVNEIVGA
ncbi:hypothetical protein FACS1894191_1410 [Clostridia bacterium]|nr:hypothetical protein FACS1894191_1410 [Clostridia bacterium]